MLQLLASTIPDGGLAFSEFITPYLPLLSGILGAMIVGLFAIWNRRRGAVETRAPDVNEIWHQQDAQSRALDLERKMRRWLEDLLTEALRAFRGYVHRVHRGGSTELNTKELKVYETKVPSLDDLKD